MNFFNFFNIEFIHLGLRLLADVENDRCVERDVWVGAEITLSPIAVVPELVSLL